MSNSGALYGDTAVRTIRDTIATLLDAELGRFKNNRKAIWIEPPAQPIPGTGLHVTIQRYPKQLSVECWRWEVILTQYDRSDAGLAKLDDAIAKMRKRYPVRTEVIPPFKEDLYPQAWFYLEWKRSAYPDFG